MPRRSFRPRTERAFPQQITHQQGPVINPKDPQYAQFTDATDRLSKAFAAAEATDNGQTVYIPAGTYDIDPDTIVINAPASGREIVVKGEGGAVIITASTTGTNILELDGRDSTGTHMTQPRTVRFENVYIDLEGKDIIGLYAHHIGQDAVLRGVQVRGQTNTGKGIYLDYATVARLENCSVQDCEYGIVLGEEPDSLTIAGANLTDNDYGIWRDTGASAARGTHINIIESRIEDNLYGVYLDGTFYYLVNIENNRFEGNTERAVTILGNSTSFPTYQVNINNNLFSDVPDAKNVIYLLRVNGFTIGGNKFRSNAGSSGSPSGTPLLVQSSVNGLLLQNENDPGKPVNRNFNDSSSIFPYNNDFFQTKWSTERKDYAGGSATNRTNYPALPGLQFAALSADPNPNPAGVLHYNGDALHFVAASDDRSLVMADGVITSDTTVANTTTETTIYTESISADELHVGQVIRVTLSGYYSTANATDTFTLRWKIGGTTVASKVSVAENVTNGPWKAVLELTVRSIGATGTVISFVEAAFNNTRDDQAATSTTTTDTTSAEDVIGTLQWDNALSGNTATITQGYTEFVG